MTAADTIRLALYEAPAAACRSLALGHTSLRSGSQRWCWESERTRHTPDVMGRTSLGGTIYDCV